MPLRSARGLHSLRESDSLREFGRFAATTLFTPQAPCGPIEPVFPALLRSLVFFAALALPFVVALYAA
ncbi:hypothetical protein JQ616_10495 [Bradyrhizobium tropiciagri]|uniref:hypothetical protein n=1 Tax=Bradyrhizobium tropiciagri TaxID=312253 RepID=UPI001BAE0D21|nr:hypothetical protein [Bradyrhizobium tropiciagri]MBR0895375.1 hypothetical protein [Bradyrhizobium tropiciagri]